MQRDSRRREPPGPEPLTEQALAVWRAHRVARCDKCELSRIWTAADGSPSQRGVICMFGNGAAPARGMVVGEAPGAEENAHRLPWAGKHFGFMTEVLEDAGVDVSGLYWTQAVKCGVPKTEGGRIAIGDRVWWRDDLVMHAVRECGPGYLDLELAAVRPAAVLALGGAAYFHFAKKAGITKARGQAFLYEGPTWTGWVVPTVHPSYVFVNPSMHVPFEADVAKFARYMEGRPASLPVDLVEVRDRAGFEAAMAELEASPDRVLTFDLETRGFIDYKPGFSKVWCVAATRGVDAGAGPRTFIIPLEHPESPFQSRDMSDGWDWSSRKHWREHADELGCDPGVVARVVRLVAGSKVNGHNVKFDVRHMKSMAARYGVEWA